MKPAETDPPLLQPASPGGERRRLRLLSYNIQVGIASGRFRHYLTHSWKHVLPFPGRRHNLDAIARFIADFDLVGLQELDAGSLRSEFLNQAEYLSRQSQLPYWYSQTNRNFGKIAKHSLGLLSRFHPDRVMEHRLPSVIPGRGALEAHFGSGPEALVVMLVHLSLSRRARSMQFGYISDVLSAHEHVIVMGDMNCACHEEDIRHLLTRTRLQEPFCRSNTYPSWRPMHAFDHILVTPGIEVEKTHAFNLSYSDHLPVGMDVLLPPGVALHHIGSGSHPHRLPPATHQPA